MHGWLRYFRKEEPSIRVLLEERPHCRVSKCMIHVRRLSVGSPAVVVGVKHTAKCNRRYKDEA